MIFTSGPLNFQHFSQVPNEGFVSFHYWLFFPRFSTRVFAIRESSGPAFGVPRAARTISGKNYETTKPTWPAARSGEFSRLFTTGVRNFLMFSLLPFGIIYFLSLVG